MTRHTHRLPAAITFGLFALAALLPSPAAAENVVCRSLTSTVKAVTIAEDYFPVTALFQSGRANLQTLLETTVSVAGTDPSCVIADFSAVVTPSDNDVVFQVTLDGVPMHGHTVFYAQPSTPVVIEMEETDLNQPRMVAHQFFLRVAPGEHTVRVRVAQGSGPGPYNSTVEAPVLSIRY